MAGRIAAACVGIVICAGLFAAHRVLSDNFDVVAAGEVYRSGQPDAESLRHFVEAHGIKSVINLRGDAHGKEWYDEEVKVAASLGLAHHDFRLSAKRELTVARASELIDLMARVPKPLLIHCDGGADRSGLASALYLAAIAKTGEEKAEAQLSIRYGHIALPMMKGYAMSRTFESLERWLGFDGS